MSGTTRDAWAAYARLGRHVYAGGVHGESHAGEGWFAHLSREGNAELNVCGLTPDATAASAAELLAAIGDDALPAIVATSAAAPPDARALLEAAGFAAGPLAEPLMWGAAPPDPGEAPFRVAPAAGDDELGAALALAADAHVIDRPMVERTLGRAVRGGGRIETWIAWDGDEPASVVFLTPEPGWVGVWSMMTAAAHRRRGAGRAVLGRALAAAWSPGTVGAVLWASVSGHRLYASCGFAVVDEARGFARGADPAMLAGLGQLPAVS